jgi:hypothetical protein
MSKVVIVRVPEAREVIPRTIFIVLARDPVVLRICRKYKRWPFLGSDKSLMVVGGRIDKVPNHLMGRPLTCRERLRGLGGHD